MKRFIVRWVLRYLRVFAKLSLLIDRPTIIGITGSAGKTSAREAIYATLRDNYKVHVIRKGNSETGVPLGILGLEVSSLGFNSIHRSIKDWTLLLLKVPTRIFFPQQFQFMILEMGIDDPLPPKNMEYLLTIVKPDIAVVMNALPVHGENFEKVVTKPITRKKIVDAIAFEKTKLVTHNPRCKVVIYNKNNESISQFLDEVNIDSLMFGNNSENHISYDTYSISEKSTQFKFILGKKRKVLLRYDGYALPEIYKEVLASAILVGEYAGMDIADIQTALEKNFKIEAGRSTLLNGINESLILDSSYNASGMDTLLSLAIDLKALTHRKLVFVFGDIRELGKSAQKEYEEVNALIKGNVDYLYTVGPLTKKYVYKEFKSKRSFKDVESFEGPHEVGKYLKKHMPDDALILFKGSQNTIYLEEAIKYVLADHSDFEKLPRQEKYWMRTKQFSLGKDE